MPKLDLCGTFNSLKYSADEINLVPISGELEPNAHKNIKMTLTAERYPTFFEGEIQCQIEWETDNEGPGHATGGTKSINTQMGDQEYLFLRLKKESKLVRSPSTHPIRKK